MSDLHARLLAAIDGITADAEWGDACGPLAAALRAVVELHEPIDTFPGGTVPIGYTACAGCDCEGYDWEHPSWPCSTVQAIARELGVPEGGDRGM